MSSFLSEGGKTYGFDLEIVKLRLTLPRTSLTSTSPTLTILESSNHPLSISTRKTKTPRKRPNQTYNEATALLSQAYPSIFPADNPHKFSKLPCEFFLDEPESLDLFLPFREIDSSGNFLPISDKLRFQTEQKLSLASGEIQSKASDLPEESIMGNISVGAGSIVEPTDGLPKSGARWEPGLGTGSRIGSMRVWKWAEEMSYWWNFPTVDVLEISPKLSSTPSPSVEKKKTTMTKKNAKKKAKKVKVIVESLKP
ncbi:hypothetical protein CRG98_008280 [Punica granatum]|uniref:Protein CHLOROPLAST IMPORT APPARATUS 2-like n=1 Tax=Punica granatum TaxID=22663 RepID=A0A2I0KSH6_PUNGR|nr:hypothetical protein CRG98_008280 [Punica granatum]